MLIGSALLLASFACAAIAAIQAGGHRTGASVIAWLAAAAALFLTALAAY